VLVFIYCTSFTYYIDRQYIVIVGASLVAPDCSSWEYVISYDWFQVGSVALVDYLHKELSRAQINGTENPRGRYGSALLVAGFPLCNQRLVYSDRVSGPPRRMGLRTSSEEQTLRKKLAQSVTVFYLPATHIGLPREAVRATSSRLGQ